MICDLCHKNPANIHIQEIVEEVKKSLHLCTECASKKQIDPSSFDKFSLAEFMSNVSELKSEISNQPQQAEVTPS